MSRRFRFILHIGTEKTGTTTLQGYLHAAQAELRKQGVAYYATPGRSEARAIAACAVGDKAQDDYLQQQGVQSDEQRQAFREEVTKNFHSTIADLNDAVHTVVVSSEHFHSRLRQPWQVEWLKDLVKPWASEVQVVVYLRPQVDMLTSFYSTALRNGDVRTLEAVSEKACQPRNHFYNYQMLLKLWGDAFGMEALQPRLFTPADLVQQDIVADFFAAIGMAAPERWDLNVPRKNESINPLGQALLRGINQAHKRAEAGLTAQEYVPLVRKVQQEFVGSGERLPEEREQTLQAAFKPSNEWVRQRWFKAREALFPPLTPRQKKAVVISEEQLELVESIIQRLDRPDVKGVPELNRCADHLRDAAVVLEKQDIVAAHHRMALAHHIRPQGPFIARKLEEYESQTGLLDKVRNWLPLGRA